jgi:predicted phage gp36 major capsid-like protein
VTAAAIRQFFAPPEMLALAREAGFGEVQQVSAVTLTQRYFAGTVDGLRPGSSEAWLEVTKMGAIRRRTKLAESKNA